MKFNYVKLTVERQLQMYERHPDKSKRSATLLHAWHQNKSWLIRLLELTQASFPSYSRHDASRAEVTEGIGIETNPSSNYLIGTITKYEEHPILRFNSKLLRKNNKNNMSLSVSINTDDQGVFDTLLENEYALMALALKKSKDEKRQELYDAEDIYKWIDYVREMGVEQVFIN